ncbi:MAG: transcriptional repressor LexA [Acidobacteriota bacterium]|nr:transcriptional repressor LexA [Acidobacteriota bacterium]
MPYFPLTPPAFFGNIRLISVQSENITTACVEANFYWRRELSMPVTARQKQVYEFISRYLDTQKQPPTIAEIGKQFQMTSPASVHSILSALEREGLIKRIPNVSRGIEVVKQENDDEGSEIPLLGLVAAGQPIEAILSHETVSAPRNMIGRGRMFALRVRGDSMIEENIQDNDIIIVSAQDTAENGQMVVALIDGNYATVKKFYREPEFIRLEPANPQYKPIFIKTPGRLQLQGVVRGLIRNYSNSQA